MVTHMNRLLALSWALLALAIPLPARAEIDVPPAMARDAANAVLPAARNNLGLVAGLSSGILADSIAIAGSPTGYAAGDTVTLTCAGCTFSTNPVVIVSAVSAGVPTAIQLRVPGLITAAPSASPTFTQSATSGSGTGLQVTASLGPRASDLASPALNSGGTANGNFILGNETPLSTFYGSETTAFGDRACSHFDGVATANSCLGHNAGGNQGAGTVTGSFNFFGGDDSGRNMTGTVNNNTCLGTNSCRVVAANNNAVVGSGSLAASSTGGQNSVLGGNRGTLISTGAANLILGANVANQTLAGGGFNILMDASNQTNSDVDTPGANTTDMLNIKRSIAGTTTNHANNNNPSLCAVGMHCVLGVLRSANFNITTDQSITIRPLTSGNVGYLAGATKYIVTDIYVGNCSASLTTAKGGFYTAASKGGTIIGAVTTPFTNCTGAAALHRLSGLTNEDTTIFTAATLFLSLTTAQGGAATGDVYILGIPIN
jgi:hypothetical protein